MDYYADIPLRHHWPLKHTIKVWIMLVLTVSVLFVPLILPWLCREAWGWGKDKLGRKETTNERPKFDDPGTVKIEF